MFPFDVILFDVGGVLLTNGWDHRERAAATERFHLDASFEARHLAHFDAWERDAISMDAYLDAVIFNQPRAFSRDEFVDFVFAQSRLLRGGAMGILKHLAASDKYVLGALNNEARETNDYRFSKFGLRDHLTVALSSCYLGLRKPEPAIYRRAIDILGGPAERFLFIDDRQENVAGAAAVGMRAIRFEDADTLCRQLVNLEVIEEPAMEGICNLD
ncbi:MAG: HAD-IA family hydrolase [Acidobacteriota bacterium]|jgi:putative hydrolase of the HAD superfamily